MKQVDKHKDQILPKTRTKNPWLSRYINAFVHNFHTKLIVRPQRTPSS